MRSHVYRDHFDVEIPASVGGMVSHRGTVMMELSLPEHYVELRSHEVLEHCSHVVCATRIGLKLASLIEQVFDISAKRFAKIEVEFDCPLLPAANQTAFGPAEQPSMETVLSEDSVGDCRYAINAAEQLNGFVFFAGDQILCSHGGGVATVVTQTSAKKHA